MISTEYISAFEKFMISENRMIKLNPGGKFNKPDGYYEKMHGYISTRPEEFILFEDSIVSGLELEFAESVEKINSKLKLSAIEIHLPSEILFIPRIKISDRVWESIIHVRVAELIRNIFDHETDADFETLRLYAPIEKKSELAKWIKTKNAKNFLFEFQVTEGVRSEALIKKRLYLFDQAFVYKQMLYMSNQFWVHGVVTEAFSVWKKDNTRWKTISHLKRKIRIREILDESRLEIKFLRLLEIHGYANQFIHDEHISWQVKYRPDFWFVNKNLIVEYDERAHSSKIDYDQRREKIIKKYLPNIHFIRIREGFEENGLLEIKTYFIEFERLYGQ